MASVDLSIVVVNWNTSAMLAECLRSVMDGAGGLSLQVIVVDNASSDGSLEMVAADFPSVTLIRNTDNRGFAAANNQGFALASGRHVLLLNSDTVVLGDVLTASVRYLDAHPDVGAMGCRVLNTDRSLQPTCSRFPGALNLALLMSGLWKLPWPPFFDRYQMTRWDRRDEREVDVVSGCYLMVRREVLDTVGGLDEDFFFYGEETDWCRRIQQAGWHLRFAPVGEIVHHGSGSVRKLNYQRDMMLSSALIKLNTKHKGLIAGLAVWVIVFLFHATRAIYWTLRTLLPGRPEVKARRDHFLALVGRHWDLLPRAKTWSFAGR